MSNKFDNISFQAVGKAEEKKPEGPREEKKKNLCPQCGEAMVMKTVSGKGKMWIHEVKGKCKLSFKTKLEMETYQKEENSKSKKENEEKNTSIKSTTTEKKVKEKAFENVNVECEVVTEAEFFTCENNEKEKAFQKETEVENMNETEKKESRRETEEFPRPVSVPSEKKSRIKRISREDAASFNKKYGAKENTLNQDPAKKVNPKQEYVNEVKQEEYVKPVSYDKTEVLKKPSYVLSYPTLTNLETGEFIEIDKPSYIIGRVEGDYIYKKTVISAKHAQFITKNGTCYVKDLNSTNGTTVNGYKLPPETEVEVKSGQTVCLADEEFMFEYEG